MNMWKLLPLLTILATLATAAGNLPDYDYERNYGAVLRGPSGSTWAVYARTTCKKGPDGKPGVEGRTVITTLDEKGFPLDMYTWNTCYTAEKFTAHLRSRFEGFSIQFSPARAALPTTTASPATGRLYVSNTSNPSLNGRSALEVFDYRTRTAVATLDVSDRLFGGLAIAPEGDRVYALMWQTTFPPTPGPAFIAVVDALTNIIADRILLPGLNAPQAPALSPDGRYLYFTAASDSDGDRVRIVDLEQRSVLGAFPPTVPSVSFLRALTVSPDGALLCATGASLYCYDTRTRTFLARVIVPILTAAERPVFHPNGSRIYVLGRLLTGTTLTVFVSVIDTVTLTEVTRIQIASPDPNVFSPTLNRMSASPDGSYLFVDESLNGTLNVIDTRTNRIVKTVEGLTTGGMGSGFAIAP
jgi:DNA-binding beta-propeller fold protein YncE